MAPDPLTFGGLHFPNVLVDKLLLPVAGLVLRQLEQLPTARRVVSSAYSADGTSLWLLTRGGSVARWDAKERQLQILKTAQKPLEFIQLSPDGKQVLVANRPGGVIDPSDLNPPGKGAKDLGAEPAAVWDAKSWKRVGGLPATDLETSSWSAAAFHPKGKGILLAGMSVVLWQPDTGKKTTFQGLDVALGPRLTALAFSPDAKQAAGGGAAAVLVWDASNGRVVRTLPHENAGTLAYAPDGARLVTGSYESARVWDAKTGRELSRLTPRLGVVKAVAFAGDAPLAVVNETSAGLVSLWNIATQRRLAEFTPYQGRLCLATFSPDGKSVLLAFLDGAAYVWQTDEPEKSSAVQGALPPLLPAALRTATAPTSTAQDVAHLHFAHGGGKLLAVSSAGEVVVWDTTNGRRLRSLIASSHTTKAAALAPGGKLLAAGGQGLREDEALTTWALAEGRCLSTAGLGTQMKAISAMTCPASGDSLVTAGGGTEQSGEAVLWDPNRGGELLSRGTSPIAQDRRLELGRIGPGDVYWRGDEAERHRSSGGPGRLPASQRGDGHSGGSCRGSAKVLSPKSGGALGGHDRGGGYVAASLSASDGQGVSAAGIGAHDRRCRRA